MPDLQSAAALLRSLLQRDDGPGSVCHLEGHHLPVLDEVLSGLLGLATQQAEPQLAAAGPSLLQLPFGGAAALVAERGAGGALAAGAEQAVRRGGVGLFSRRVVDGRSEGERSPVREQVALALTCAYLALVLFNVLYAACGCGRRREAAAAGVKPGVVRCDIWDASKFILMTGVIFFHCAFYLSAEDLTDWTLSRALLRPVVPCFIFVSGVFGASVSGKALFKAAFYPWPCVLVIGGIFALGCADARLAKATEGFNGFAFWYLWCLCFWRLTVSPIVYVGNAMLGVPVFFWLLGLQVAAYVLLGSTGSWGGSWNDVWRCYLFYAPIFAAGQLATPSFWKDTFAEKPRAAGTTVASVTFLMMWYLLFAASPKFGQWNTAYCIDEETCKMGNYGIPNDVLHEPISEANLCENLATFALRLGIALAYLGTLGAGLHGLQAICPALTSLAAGWGERSLYAYVLHHLWLELAMAAGGKEMLDLAPAFWRPGLCFALALQATVVLSSEGTERLIRWLLIPPWI